MTQTESGEPGRKAKRLKTVWWVIGSGLVALVVVLGVVCNFLGIRSITDLGAYCELSRDHFHPIWKDLALRRFTKGDDLEPLLARHAPSQREDVLPYTKLVYSRGLTVIARDGCLIAAMADTTAGRHVFFYDLEQMHGFEPAYRKYTEQRELETDAYKVHRAIASGQDVFLARLVKRSEVPATPAGTDSMMDELKKIYGERYLAVVRGTRPELTVEVTKVLSGSLEPGTTLTFPGDNCDETELAEPEILFVHFEDDRELDPSSKGEPLYLTVPRRALDWYQSLTPDQVKEFDARWSSQ